MAQFKSFKTVLVEKGGEDVLRVSEVLDKILDESTKAKVIDALSASRESNAIQLEIAFEDMPGTNGSAFELHLNKDWWGNLYWENPEII